MKKTKSNRIKLPAIQAPVITTRAELEAVTREVVELTLTRNKQQAELDQAITKLREGYEKTFGETDAQLTARTEAVRAWAEMNGPEFKGLKSLELTHATIGFRTGQPALKTLPKWTFKKALEAMLLLPKLSKEYIRRDPELDKAKIIADRKIIGADGLLVVGLEVVQEESFFIDPKIETPENRQTVAQAAYPMKLTTLLAVAFVTAMLCRTAEHIAAITHAPRAIIIQSAAGANAQSPMFNDQSSMKSHSQSTSVPSVLSVVNSPQTEFATALDRDIATGPIDRLESNLKHCWSEDRLTTLYARIEQSSDPEKAKRLIAISTRLVRIRGS